MYQARVKSYFYKERKVIMNDEIKLTEEQEKEFANGKGDDEE